MKLYHVTPRCNLDSIKAIGLVRSCSQTGRPEIWLVPRGKVKWAIMHCQERHSTRDVVVIYWNLHRIRPQPRPNDLYVSLVDLPPSGYLGLLDVEV